MFRDALKKKFWMFDDERDYLGGLFLFLSFFY